MFWGSGGTADTDFRRSGLVYAALDADETQAADRVRPVLATVLRGKHHARNLALAGSQLDQDALAANNPAAAASLIDNTIVARHAAAGRAETFRQRISAYKAAGLDDVILAGMRTPAQITAVLTALAASE